MSCLGRVWLGGSFFSDGFLVKFAAIGLMAGLVAVGPRANAADNDPAEKKIPAPAEVELETNDGLQLQATYYGSLAGKSAVPIIMLHGWKGSRADLPGWRWTCRPGVAR